MQNTVQAAAFTPPMHIQSSNAVVEDGLLLLTAEHSLWTSKGDESYIPHRNDSPLPFKLKRARGHHRFHLHPVIFAALAAAAMAYLLVRCAQHLGVLQMQRCFLRSAVSDEGDTKDSGPPCVLENQGELAVVAAESEILDEEQVDERVKLYTLELANTMKESVVELSALCSLLDPIRRQPVKDAVDALRLEAGNIKGIYTYQTTSRARLRHIHCMDQFLWELPGMDFTATSMSTVERLLKLAQLLTLQQAALTQIQDGIRMLAEFCRQEAEPLPEEGEKERLNAVYQTTDVRRNHVLQDDILGKWLRDKQAGATRFGLAAPSIIENIIASPPKPYEELLKELRNTPLGLWQQQNNPSNMQDADAQANGQGRETHFPSAGSAEQVETIRTSQLSSSESSVGEPEERPVVDASAGQAPERLSVPGNAFSGQLGLGIAAGASGVAQAGGESLSSALAPLYTQSVLSLLSHVPVSSGVTGSHRGSEDFSSSEASEAPALQGVPLPSPFSEVYISLVFSGHSATSSSSKTSNSFKPSDLATTARHFWPPQASPPQVSGQFATHEIDVPPANAEREGSSSAGWAFDTGGESSTYQMPLSHQPIGSRIGIDGAAEARTGLESVGWGWLTGPDKQGLWSPHIPGSPLSQPTLPRDAVDAFYYIQPGSQRDASGQFPTRVPDVASIWRLHDPGVSEAVLQSSPWESGTPVHPLAVAAGSTRPDMQAGGISQGRSRPETFRAPFKGVAVGEPAGGINEQDSTPAARVAIALFSPNSADFSRGLLSRPSDSGSAD